jgi:hypothetical protein
MCKSVSKQTILHQTKSTKKQEVRHRILILSMMLSIPIGLYERVSALLPLQMSQLLKISHFKECGVNQ